MATMRHPQRPLPFLRRRCLRLLLTLLLASALLLHNSRSFVAGSEDVCRRDAATCTVENVCAGFAQDVYVRHIGIADDPGATAGPGYLATFYYYTDPGRAGRQNHGAGRVRPGEGVRLRIGGCADVAQGGVAQGRRRRLRRRRDQRRVAELGPPPRRWLGDPPETLEYMMPVEPGGALSRRRLANTTTFDPDTEPFPGACLLAKQNDDSLEENYWRVLSTNMSKASSPSLGIPEPWASFTVNLTGWIDPTEFTWGTGTFLANTTHFDENVPKESCGTALGTLVPVLDENVATKTRRQQRRRATLPA